MPERETAAMGEELWWRDRAMWLLVRRLGGEVTVTAEEWESAPERPDLIIDRDGEVMRWTAREADKASDFIPDFIPGQLPLPGTETP